MDDFSLGLDPGYRRLFGDYLKEYAGREEKTVFLTSHIIQDMERLIDDVIIMDYGKLLLQKPIDYLLNNFRRISFDAPASFEFIANERFYNPARIGHTMEVFTFLPEMEVRQYFAENDIPSTNFMMEALNLEEAFIGLTGKY